MSTFSVQNSISKIQYKTIEMSLKTSLKEKMQVEKAEWMLQGACYECKQAS